MIPGIQGMHGVTGATTAPTGSRPAGIQFIGRTTDVRPGGTGTVTVSLTSLTSGIDSAPIAGDFALIIWAGTSNAGDLNPTAPTGYTQHLDTLGNDTYEANLIVWYKFLTGGSDLISVDVPLSGNDLWASGCHVRVFSGVNASTPFDVATTTSVGSNSAADPPAITPVTSGAKIVVAACAADANEANFTNDTADLTDFISTQQSDNADIVLATGLKMNWTSGAFDPGAWGNTQSSSADAHAAATMALRPA
jgi:hypothetical protein